MPQCKPRLGALALLATIYLQRFRAEKQLPWTRLSSQPRVLALPAAVNK